MEDAIGLQISSFFTDELWVTDDHDGGAHGYCDWERDGEQA